jgi:hypothetical protein
MVPLPYRPEGVVSVSHVVLHNRNTGEDFRYDVPEREAQALIDLAWGGARHLSWAVKDASDDIAVPACLKMTD